MAKTNITLYSSTPSSNTDINSINIDENCPASGLNNAIRELMAHLKNVDTGSQALTALSVTGSVTATTSLKTPLIEFTDGDNALTIADGGNVTANADLTVSGAFTSQGIDDNADAIALTVDSSESVGIGISNPSSYDDGADKLVVGKTDDRSGITIVSSTSTAGSIHFADGTGTSSYRGIIGYYHDNDSMRFYTGGASEKMRINSSGASTFGLIDSSPYVATEGFVVALNNGVKYGILTGCDHVGNREAIAFVNPNGQVGSIRTNGTATSFNTSSDHRLKENVTADWNATTRLKQLNPVRFNFIADADTTVDGFLAHEVQSVVPEAISGEKDAVDDDGNIIPQGIDQSKIVPLLVKTIQELEARITALENA